MLDGMPKDLREMSEGQFAEAFEMLRERTKDWSEPLLRVLSENPQFLSVIRCGLGLSKLSLAKILMISLGEINNVEAGITKLKMIKKKTKAWLISLEGAVLKDPPSLERGLKTWGKFQFSRDRNLTSIPQTNKSISNASEEEIKARFKRLMKDTKCFTEITPKILFDNPQSLLIFRLLLRFTQGQFARELETDFSCLNEWENGKTKMRFQIAEKLSSKLSNLFERFEPELKIENVLTGFKMFRNGGSSRRPLDWLVENGLRSVKGAETTESEREVIKILNENCIPFERNAIVEGVKRKINVDFAIPSGVKPEIVVETFLFGSRKITFCEFGRKLRLTDQRFQMLKLRNPSIKTVTNPKITLLEDFQRERIEKLSELEVLNTDFILINERIKELPKIVKRIISN